MTCNDSSTTRLRSLLVAAALCVAAALAACNVDPYCITCAEDDGGTHKDAGMTGDGGGDGDGDAGDGDAGIPPDACLPSVEGPTVPSSCDGIDNDCDTMIDEGFDFDNDPNNCGGCGIHCTRTGANGTCEAGLCVYACKPNNYDLNGDINNTTSNGCEYFCNPPNPAGPDGLDDVCDEADDDCDNMIDEDVDKLTDVNNCGGCGNVCAGINATPYCDSGTCDDTCDRFPGTGTGCVCDEGFEDLLSTINGCEYQCPDSDPTTPGVQPPRPLGDEDCDGVDNDCDGQVDELPIAGLGDDCTDPGFELIGDTGECAFGVRGCSFGVPTCIGYVRPQPEVCETGNVDVDCDGVDDNGFETLKLTDVRYCENCQGCDLPNAIPTCNAGTCEILACLPGFVDADGIAINRTATNPGNGCEYPCTPSGPEVCDGIDNDCDGDIDEPGPAPGGIGDPPAGLCRQLGACAGTVAQCTATPCDPVVTWRCVYEAPAELEGNPACGILVSNEQKCDGWLPGVTSPDPIFDGDCDGAVDDSFPRVLSPATGCVDNTQTGICQGSGHYTCDPSDDSKDYCYITTPGQPKLDGELCNNLDDDCDGTVDEDAWDQMVQISTGPDVWIDTFEASRPDSTVSTQGAVGDLACSNDDILPWRNVSWNDAVAACAARGKRLCTEDEWRDACDGTLGLGGNKYPYGPTYIDDYCNGKDYDPDCTGLVDEVVQATGSDYVCPLPHQADTCVSDFGAYDMSGNLSEWTSTQIGTGPDTYRVKGGNYNTVKQGLTCDHAFVSFTPDTIFPNLGFRCCSDTAPPAMPQPVP